MFEELSDFQLLNSSLEESRAFADNIAECYDKQASWESTVEKYLKDKLRK